MVVVVRVFDLAYTAVLDHVSRVDVEGKVLEAVLVCDSGGGVGLCEFEAVGVGVCVVVDLLVDELRHVEGAVEEIGAKVGRGIVAGELESKPTDLLEGSTGLVGQIANHRLGSGIVTPPMTVPVGESTVAIRVVASQKCATFVTLPNPSTLSTPSLSFCFQPWQRAGWTYGDKLFKVSDHAGGITLFAEVRCEECIARMVHQVGDGGRGELVHVVHTALDLSTLSAVARLVNPPRSIHLFLDLQRSRLQEGRGHGTCRGNQRQQRTVRSLDLHRRNLECRGKSSMGKWQSCINPHGELYILSIPALGCFKVYCTSARCRVTPLGLGFHPT
ncbi:hypothetical protein L1887_61883 [Cichorium endivia]|nr:hypothetical protein L1887_61883 [Cichorium endivia]